MTLFETLKQDNQDAFEKWFNRWYESSGIEKKIIINNQKGHTNLLLSIDVDDNYLSSRLKDSRTIQGLQSKLGDEFSINYKEEYSSITLFGMRRRYGYISIDWGEQDGENS